MDDLHSTKTLEGSGLKYPKTHEANTASPRRAVSTVGARFKEYISMKYSQIKKKNNLSTK